MCTNVDPSGPLSHPGPKQISNEANSSPYLDGAYLRPKLLHRPMHRHSDSRMQLELTRHVRRNRWRCTRHPNRSGPLPLNPPELPEITQIHTPHLIHANSTKCTQPTRPRPNTSSLPSSYLDLLPSSHITTSSPLPSSSILLKSTHQSPRMPAMLKITVSQSYKPHCYYIQLGVLRMQLC